MGLDCVPTLFDTFLRVSVLTVSYLKLYLSLEYTVIKQGINKLYFLIWGISIVLSFFKMITNLVECG